VTPAAARPRRRLSRTVSRARWREYRALLLDAQRCGYRPISLEEWVRREPGDENAERTLILRHDVDQHPRSALAMAAVEEELGLRSTWYFRWRTAHEAVVGDLRAKGFAVGLHYETLSRRALETGLGPSDDPSELVEESRDLLRAELAAFEDRHGPARSACPHGDSRVPWIHNGVLLRGRDLTAYGIDFDGNDAMRRRKARYWLTDRSAAEGGWEDGVDPERLFDRGVSPILCLTHPNNWVSGPSLWVDRALARVLPYDFPAKHFAPHGPIRTVTDQPPV
jgi:hypothetical protein